MRIQPVFLFDLDGTLVDSVYEHVLAWKQALDAEGLELSVWRIHRRIGMSGGLFTNQLARETGVELDEARLKRLAQAHAEAYRGMGARSARCPARGSCLTTSALNPSPGPSPPAGAWRRRASISPRSASIPPRRRSSPAIRSSTQSPIRICSWPPPLGSARPSKPLMSSAIRSGTCSPPRRCRALGVGLLSGGYGERELQLASALRVYEDPADLLAHIYELGGGR